MRRLSLLGWLTVLLVFVLFVAGSVAIDSVVRDCRLFSVDENGYAAANLAVLATVPVFPGSIQTNTGSMGEQALNRCYRGENTGPYDSYRTYVNYETLAGTTPAETLAFYDQHFARNGWVRSETSPQKLIRYTNGQAYVDLWLVLQGYSLTADHDVTD